MKLNTEIEPIKQRTLTKSSSIYAKKNKCDYYIFVVGINAGLRAGGLVSLKIRDVSGENRIFDEITIEEQKTEKTKTFALNKNAKEAIRLWLDTLKRDGPNDYLFGSKKDGHPEVKHLHHIIKKQCIN